MALLGVLALTRDTKFAFSHSRNVRAKTNPPKPRSCPQRRFNGARFLCWQCVVAELLDDNFVSLWSVTFGIHDTLLSRYGLGICCWLTISVSSKVSVWSITIRPMAIDKDGVIGVRIITRYRMKAWRQWRDDHRIIGITVSIEDVRGATCRIIT